jgi:YegS/Rv2252/BmrU family lipid kinase
MAQTQKIAFLINPASGSAASQNKGRQLLSHLLQNAPSGYEVMKTNSVEEMLDVTRHLTEKNYRAIFACGGDGTLNLISSQIMGTDTALGIIPLGSGNGYARHNHIPMEWAKALAVAQNPVERWKDTGLFNGLHFLNIAGVGYDAKISHAFKNQQNRGLSGYVRTVLKNLRVESFDGNLQNENGMWYGKIWLVDFCNGSQWGNNFRIAPSARDDDGTFCAVVVKKSNPLRMPILGLGIARGKTEKLPEVYTMNGGHFLLTFQGELPFHLDGEAAGMVENHVEVQVVPKSLRLWCPA